MDTNEVQMLSVDELKLSNRPHVCLWRAGIYTVGELCEKTPEDLLSLRNFNQKCLDEVTLKLGEYGLTLKGDQE